MKQNQQKKMEKGIIKISQKELIKDIKNVCEKFIKKGIAGHVTRDFYRANGKYSDKDVNTIFGSWGNVVKKLCPAQKKIKEEKQKIQRDNFIIEKKAKIGKKYVVSAIVDGANICEEFISSLEMYCKHNKAELILLWMRGNGRKDTLSQELFDRFKDNIVTDFVFNSNLRASDFMLSPAQILPITGLERYGTRHQSLIIASTKQFMQSVDRPKNELPHVIWTTGTVSLPKYSKTRIGALGRQDNLVGGLIVEVQNDKRFHVRQIQWLNNCFIDLGIKYTKNEVKKVGCEAIIWGDLHCPETSSLALKVAIEQTNCLNAKEIIIHDVSSFNSVNAHLKGKYLSKTLQGDQNRKLQTDFEKTKDMLEYIEKSTPKNNKIVIVHSNHTNFISRYIEDGEFIKDTTNAVYAAECFIDFSKGEDPIQKRLKTKKTLFLKQDESYKICGVELGMHGHLGAAGSRGSLRQYFYRLGSCIVGHSHKPEIIGNAYSVGTLSEMDLGYNQGLGAWIWSTVALYENGGRQNLIFVDDKWRL